jgi:sulfate transport system permease protein
MTATLDAPVADEPAAAPKGRRRARLGPTKPRLGAGSGLGLGVIVIWMTILVLLPLAAVVSKAFSGGWSQFSDAITNAENASALKLTIGLSVSVAIVNGVMGTLVAWVLVRERFRGAGIFEMVIDIPFALPTIVAGVVMVALYGGNSPVHVHLIGTRIGIFVALLFVTLPFTVRTVQPVLIDLDRDAEQAAASLGAKAPAIFRRIILPQILPAASSGIALAFARALGEYGSLVLISSNRPFHTEIASSLIYGKLQDATNPVTATRQAAALATVLLLTSAVVLFVIEIVQRRVVSRRG